MKRWMIGLVLVVVSLAATNAFSAVQVAIDSGYLYVEAYDGVSYDYQTITPTMPLSTTSTATVGTATSTATYNFSNSGGTAVFANSMTQSFGVGERYGNANGYFNFTLSETVTYSIAGAFSGSGTDSGDKYYEYACLDDLYAGNVFDENDYVIGDSASLALDGVVQGSGYAEGSLTGTLSPGQYQFWYWDYVYDKDGDKAGSADASGYVSLTLTKVIPEPSTLIIWSILGALGITVGWWRRRRRVA